MGDGSIHHKARRRQKSLIELLARADHVIAAELATQMRHHGVSGNEWRVLAALLERDGGSMTELAEQARSKQATLTKTIARMERSALVERRGHSEDLRRVLVCLTEHGRNVAVSLRRQARQKDAAIARAFGKVQSRELKAALLDLIGLVQNQPSIKRDS